MKNNKLLRAFLFALASIFIPIFILVIGLITTNWVTKDVEILSIIRPCIFLFCIIFYLFIEFAIMDIKSAERYLALNNTLEEIRKTSEKDLMELKQLNVIYKQQ